MSDDFTIDDILKEMEAKPDDPNSKSPCGKCLGYECGCMIAGERVPSEECACFHDKTEPIVVEFYDGSKLDANPNTSKK